MRHVHNYPLLTGVCECGHIHPTIGPVRWKPRELYRVGSVVQDEGIAYRIVCPEHGDDCPGGELRSGYLPPRLCIEDGRKGYKPLDINPQTI